MVRPTRLIEPLICDVIAIANLRPAKPVELTADDKAFLSSRSDPRIVKILVHVPAAVRRGTTFRKKHDELTRAIISGDTGKQEKLWAWFTQKYPKLRG